MNEKKAFISLIRLGIGHHTDAIDNNIDWVELFRLAGLQGLSAIVLDGIERLPDKTRPPKELLLQWIGNTLQSYEYRYEMYKRTIAELAEWHNSNGYKMMVLKGYACSLNWPNPMHRPCGDIDIWQFGKQKEADKALAKDKGIKIDNSHQHHTVFYWRDFMVENHYDFINVYAHKSNAELEKIFKELGTNESFFVEVYGEKVNLPSPNLHALLLIKHMASHFASSEISLRQVLDWAFFVEKHSNEVDWEWLSSLLEKFGMKEFFNLINGICVDDLGFPSEMFYHMQFLPDIKEKVLKDILEPAYGATEPPSFIPRMVYKYRRWHGNAWKHELCYNETRWDAFWHGVRNHMIKPTAR